MMETRTRYWGAYLLFYERSELTDFSQSNVNINLDLIDNDKIVLQNISENSSMNGKCFLYV